MENKSFPGLSDELLEKQHQEIIDNIEAQRAKGMNVPESVWADGVPEKIDEKDVVHQNETLPYAINHLMEHIIIPHGFKVEQGFPRPEYPNIIMKKDGKTYAVVVVGNIYPGFVSLDDTSRIKFVQACREKDLIPLFASVGYRSYDPARAKAGLMLKKDIYITTFNGFIVLNDSPKQIVDLEKDVLKY